MKKRKDEKPKLIKERPARAYRHREGDIIEVTDIWSVKQLQGYLKSNGYLHLGIKETTPSYIHWLVRFRDTSWAEISTPRSSTFETALRWVLQSQG